MTNSIDQSTDYSHRELYSYLSGVTLPEYVKEASLEDINEPMVKTACADRQYGLFPVNTKVATYVSNAFFVHKIDALRKQKGDAYINKVACIIGDAVTTWGIGKDIEAFNKIALERLEQDYTEKNVVFKVGEDEIDLFTVKTASDLSREAAHFANNPNKFPFEWRRDIADQFVKAAEQLGVDELPDLVLKYAGQYYPDIVNVKAELSRRMTKLSADNKARYQQLIDDVVNIESKDEFFKLAEVVHYIEKNAGLYDKSHYRKILGDPVDKLFTLHFEKVAEICNVVEMGGEKFAAADLEAIAADVYEQAFGFELDPKSAEAREILPTMPKSDVSLFKHLSGVKPI